MRSRIGLVVTSVGAIAFASGCSAPSEAVDKSGAAVSIETGLDGAYVITSVNSGLGLEDNGNSSADGAVVDTWSYGAAPGTNSQWILRPSGNAYSIMNLESGKCLDNWGGATNGVGVRQYDCYGGAAQQWKLVEASDGSFDIVSIQNARCLDNDGAAGSGTQAMTWDCWEGSTQHWRVERLSSVAFGTARPYLLTSRNSGLGLEDNGNSDADGAVIDTWSYGSAPGPNSQWVLQPSQNGSYAIVNVESGKCLDNWGGATNGVGVRQYDCYGGAAQQWNLRPATDGTFDVVSVQNGRCLDNDGAAANGTQAMTWDCWEGSTQHWWIDPAVEALTPALFLDTLTMLDNGRDWDVNHGKATCGEGEAITGISEVPNGQARTGLCGALGPVFSGNVTATLTSGVSGDQRRAERLGDWAPNYFKWECGEGEYVRAVSEDASFEEGNNRFHAIQCASAPGVTDACTTRVFDADDDRGTTAPNDWDYGAYKGQCAANEYVAGVSLSTQTGAPHSILCCAATAVVE